MPFRQFVVTFLVLAVVTTSVVLVFPRTSPGTSLSQRDAYSSGKAQLPGSAFTKNSVSGLSSDFSGSDALLPVTQENSSNLTEGLVNVLAKEFVEGNPLGPREEGGELVIDVPPNVEDAVETYTSRATVSSDVLFPRINRTDLKVVVNATDKDREVYFAALDKIVSDIQQNPTLQTLNAQGITEDVLATVYFIQKEVVKKARAISTPESFIDFHVAFLKVLESQTTFLELTKDDPLRAVLLADAADDVLRLQLEELQAEVGELSFSGDKSIEHIVRTIFGIQVVHAQAGGGVVHDPKTNLTQLAEWLAKHARDIYEWAVKIAKEYLKNRLLTQFTQTAIKWALGGGQDPSPRFVTNWKNYFERSYDAAVGRVLYELEPNLCYPTVIRNIFTPTQGPPGAGGAVCTLSQVVRNINQFRDDFAYGGWAGYTAALRPENNFWGNIFITRELIDREALRERQAREADALAGGGYTGTKECVNQRDIGPGPDPFNDPLISSTFEVIEARGCDPNTNICQQIIVCDEFETTTPGTNVAYTVGRAITAPIDRIVNAETFEALVQYFLDSLFSKLFASGDKGILRGDLSTAASPTANEFCNVYVPGTQEHDNCVTNLTDPPIETGEITEDDLACSAIPVKQPGSESVSRNFFLNQNYAVPLSGQPPRILTLNFPEVDGHYTKINMEFDYFMTQFDVLPPRNLHNIFAIRNQGDPTQLPEPNLKIFLWVEPTQLGNGVNGYQAGTGRGHGQRVPVSWQANTWYHFSFVYDAEQNVQLVTVTDIDNGGVVARLQNVAPYSLYPVGAGVKLLLHAENLENGVKHMEGAMYRNITVNLEPGSLVCNDSGQTGGAGSSGGSFGDEDVFGGG